MNPGKKKLGATTAFDRYSLDLSVGKKPKAKGVKPKKRAAANASLHSAAKRSKKLTKEERTEKRHQKIAAIKARKAAAEAEAKRDPA